MLGFCMSFFAAGGWFRFKKRHAKNPRKFSPSYFVRALIERQVNTHTLHKVIIHKWANFMEQKLRFGLVSGQFASTEKKFGQLLGRFFRVFMGKKDIFKLFKKYCSARTKKLHKMKVTKCKFFLGNLIMNWNRLQKHIQLCLALLEIAHRET